jgi:hypothetical protein
MDTKCRDCVAEAVKSFYCAIHYEYRLMKYGDSLVPEDK